MRDLAQKIDALPPELRREVEDFVDFLRTKHEPVAERRLRLGWRGALADLRDDYTSVELQHEALRLWRGD